MLLLNLRPAARKKALPGPGSRSRSREEAKLRHRINSVRVGESRKPGFADFRTNKHPAESPEFRFPFLP